MATAATVVRYAVGHAEIDGRGAELDSSGVYYWITSELFTHLGFLLALVFLANLLEAEAVSEQHDGVAPGHPAEPYVGVPLYVMFGGRKMNPLARKKARIYSRSPGASKGPAESGPERLLASYGVPPARDGNRIELVSRRDRRLRRLLRLIEEARSTIHITTYILGWDEGSRAILERLTATGCARGSRCGC